MYLASEVSFSPRNGNLTFATVRYSSYLLYVDSSGHVSEGRRIMDLSIIACTIL